MNLIKEILPICNCFVCWKRPSRYGYTVIRAPQDSSQVSLLSNVSLDKPIPSQCLEFVEENQEDITHCLADLKTSQILLEIPTLGRRLTHQLSEFHFQEDEVNDDVRSEKEEVLRQNLVYLASQTQNVGRFINELYARRLLTYDDVLEISNHGHPILKALEVYKRTLKLSDSMGFIIGALKVAGSDFVAEILVGSFPLSSNTELICRICLNPEFSPDFNLEGQPGKYKKFVKIPRERQENLVSITGSYLEIKAKTLLKSLEFSPAITSIKLTSVRLQSEFTHKVYLPHLKEFVFHVISDEFRLKKDFYDYITPRRISSMLFFTTDENNNTDPVGDDNITFDNWSILKLWRLNVDISLKIAGRTVLLIDHVRCRLLSRLENNYRIPENIIQPPQVRNLYLGWCRISKSSIPLQLTRLHLYSVEVVDASKDRTYLCSVLNHLLSLREFKYWGNVSRQPWPILKTSLLPKKLKIIAASFVEIWPDKFLSHLESVCLYVYNVVPENQLTFLTHFLQSSRRVSLINFYPFQRPTQEQLLSLLRSGRARQIVFSGCEHSLSFDKHYMYFTDEILKEIHGSQTFHLFQENRGWKAENLSTEGVLHHLYLKFAFETVYSPEAFRQHEIIPSLWKHFLDL